MNKNIEIVSLVFKSTDYLKSIVEEFLRDYSQAEGWEVGFRVIGNDATDEVVKKMNQYELELPPNFKMDYYHNINPNKFYMKRVYDAWNYCVQSTKYDNICLTGSDHIWSEDWLKNLLKHHDGTNIPACRLVESGKMDCGINCINASKTFDEPLGFTPMEFDRKRWEIFTDQIREDRIEASNPDKRAGYMPVVFETKRFLEAGGYQSERYSISNPYFMPDVELFKKLELEYKMRHVNVFDSLVYHIQEGEKDE